MRRTPLRRRTLMRRRRSRRHVKPGSAKVVNPAAIERARQRAGGRCEWCGRRAQIEVHHIIPRGMGGARRLDVDWAMIGLCREHHDAAQQYRIPRRALLARTVYLTGALWEDVERVAREMGVRV